MATAPQPSMNPNFEPPPPYQEAGQPKPSYQAPPPQPQQGGYAAQPMLYQHQPPVQTVFVQAASFGASPTSLTCPKCSANIITELDYESGLLAWIICGVLVFFGCWLGCCLIPFCVDGAKDVRHVCPNCRATLGYCRRL